MRRVAIPGIVIEVLAVFFAYILLHASLLRLPYFWDEAGYYIPAARDLFLHGSLIPQSTLLTGHPPLSAAWLSLAWSLFGETPLVTRLAMLLVSSFGLVQFFHLARRLAGRNVALAASFLTALYPVYFAQSALAHADTLATALTFCGLNLYFKKTPSRWPCVLAFSLAALAKETAVVVPASLFLWESLMPRLTTVADLPRSPLTSSFLRAATLLLTGLPLSAWFAYHFLRTGHVFGGQDFFQYNVAETLHPLRFALALVQRLWQVLGHMNLYVLTVVAVGAWFLLPPPVSSPPRPSLPPSVRWPLLLVVAGSVLFHSLVGGAVLARYMLPVVPLAILSCVMVLWRRVRQWPALIIAVAFTFVVGWYVPPPYRYAPEDGLFYADFIHLQQDAVSWLTVHHRSERILTAWPASDGLSHPELGYVSQPWRVVAIRDFTPDQLALASASRDFDAALVFSLKPGPLHRIIRWPWWDAMHARFFGAYDDLSPQQIAVRLQGVLVFERRRGAQWVAVISFPRARDARLSAPPVAGPAGRSSGTSPQ
jgi:hypothetical protein